MKKILFLIATFVIGLAMISNVYAQQTQEVTDEQTLNEAITALSTTGGVIDFKNDITTDGLITINTEKPITIKLNTFKLDRKNSSGNTMLNITKGEVTINGPGTVEILHGNAIIANGADVKVTLDGGNYISNANAENSILVQNGASITVKGNANINGYYGITVWDENSQINFEKGEIQAKAFAISGNGSGTSNSVINISGGTLTSEIGAAIYQPQTGTLNITGGNITGPIAILARQGQVNISGGTITANGNAGETIEIGYEGQELPLGTAIIVDNTEETYEAMAKVTITGGDFKSNADSPIVSISNTKSDIQVGAGATFDKTVNPLYLEEGLTQNASGKVVTSSSLKPSSPKEENKTPTVPEAPNPDNTNQAAEGANVVDAKNPDTSDNYVSIITAMFISISGLVVTLKKCTSN